MKPGNYKFLRVSDSKNPKYGKNLSSNKFILADNTITIIQDKLIYKQTNKGGSWYTYNIDISFLGEGAYKKLIEKLEENENFKSWKIICKFYWCNPE